MKRIQGTCEIDKEKLKEFPWTKEKIIDNLLIGLSREMHKIKAIDITEENLHEETFIRAQVYILTKDEIKRAITLLNIIKSCYPPEYNVHINELINIFAI